MKNRYLGIPTLLALFGLIWLMPVSLASLFKTSQAIAPGGVGTGITLWLKADAGTTIQSNQVSYWRDQSGNGAHAGQTQSAFRPGYKTNAWNGFPVLTFNGLNQFIYNSTKGASTGGLFVVYRPSSNVTPSTKGHTFINWNLDSNNVFGIGNFEASLSNELLTFGQQSSSGTWYYNYSTGGSIAAKPQVFSSVKSALNSGRQSLSINGKTVSTQELNPSAYSAAADQRYLIGMSFVPPSNADYKMNGELAEVVSYSGSLGEMDQQRIVSYLALKYGLTIDQTSSTMLKRTYLSSQSDAIWDPVQHPGFVYNIAGIGNDDASGLVLNTSKSTEPGDIVQITAPNGLFSSLFLLWANDGKPLSYTNNGAPTGFERMQRTWEVQEKGETGNLQISGAGEYILIDRDGDGFQDETPISIQNLVNLQSGNRFTFANSAQTTGSTCGFPGGVSSGLSTWLRADEGIVGSNQKVNIWKDQSGKGHHAVQSDATNQPEIDATAINGLPALRINNNRFLESLNGGFHTSDYFVVFKPFDYISASTEPGVILSSKAPDATGDNTFFGYNNLASALGGEMLAHIVGHSSKYATGYSSTQTYYEPFYPYIANAKDNDGKTSTNIFLNGLQVNNTQSGSYQEAHNQNYVLGAGPDYLGGMDGYLAEMIVFDTKTTDTQRRNIQSYLAMKYGITLDQLAANLADRHYYRSDATIIWDAARNATHNKRIAGIGSDVGSCWRQTQSTPQAPDPLVTIKMADTWGAGSFLVVGDNGQGYTDYTSVGALRAIKRTWKTQTTGTIGKTILSVSVQETGSAMNTWYLLLDQNKNGSFTDDSPIQLTLSQGSWVSPAISFQDNQLFTLASGCSGLAGTEKVVREEYYLPVPEDQAFSMLQTIYPSTAQCNGLTQYARGPKAPLYNYTSLTTQQKGTIVFYDHWEDGYEANLENPTQASTQIWGDGNIANGYPPGIPCDYFSGEAIVLNNQINPTTLGSVLDFDGGDRIAASGPITVTKANWADGSKTLFAGAVEVYSTDYWSTRYVVPIGQNVAVNANSFEYTGAYIQAKTNGTQVQIDVNADGSIDQTVTLAQGQSHFINGGIQAGAVITSSQPVQVTLITGDICDNYEMRWLNLPGEDYVCSSYYCPVSDPTTMYYFYNPHAQGITIKHRTNTGAQADIFIPAKGFSIQFFGSAPSEGHHFYAPDQRSFYAAFFYSVNDYGQKGSFHDWGALMLCEDLLPRSFQFGWADGQNPELPRIENGSPIWLVAGYPTGSNLTTPIRIAVDFNGDSKGPITNSRGVPCDRIITLTPLEATRVYDPDGDQTGMVLTIDDPQSTAFMSVFWGQDGTKASPSDPGLDLGTGMSFSTPFYIRKTVAEQSGDGKYTPGEKVTYTLELSTVGQNILSGPFLFLDTLPTGLQYISGTTKIQLPNQSNTLVADDNGIGQSPFPLDEIGKNLAAGVVLQPGQKIVVTFDAYISNSASGAITNRVQVFKAGQRKTDEVSLQIEGGQVPTFDLALTKKLAANQVGKSFQLGETVNFELTIYNQGEEPAYRVQLTDYVPNGLELASPAWQLNNGLATYTHPGPIAPGQQVTIPLAMKVISDDATEWVNAAEISAADNDTNPNNTPPTDKDSYYDQVRNNDAGPVDDVISGDGTGFWGSGVAATDEDDHDMAIVPVSSVFDLALRKRIDYSLTSLPLGKGKSVTYTIEVFNQGTEPAYNIELVDYIPAGTVLMDNAWLMQNGKARRTLVGPLPAGQKTEVKITILIPLTYNGIEFTNGAEIYRADNDTNPNNPYPVDRDSRYDDNAANDAGGVPNSPSDDAVDGNGTGSAGSIVAATDEDDHDISYAVLCNVNAGSDGETEVCISCGTSSVFVNLFGALQGNPSVGGLWIDTDNTGVNLSNPQQVNVSSLAIGTYTFSYRVGGTNGCVTTTSKVTLRVTRAGSMACNNLINLPMPDNCVLVVPADLILEGSAACAQNFEVRLADENNRYIGNTITAAYVGQTLTATIVNTDCNTFCAGKIRVYDNKKPSIVCTDPTLDLVCNDVQQILNQAGSLEITGRPQVSDNCTGSANLTLTFSDQLVSGQTNCSSDRILRTFVVRDASGNENSCTQTITIRKPNSQDMRWPISEIRLDCDAEFLKDSLGRPHPSVTGYPKVKTYFGEINLSNVVCNIGATYNDGNVIQICSGSYTFIRTWTVLNWCNTVGQNQLVTYQQIIKVEDTTPPVVTCPLGNMADGKTVYSTGPIDCSASFIAPLPVTRDNCSGVQLETRIIRLRQEAIRNVFGEITGYRTVEDIMQVIGQNAPNRLVNSLPRGEYLFRYIASDGCGNKTQLDCPFEVKDQTEPVAVCDRGIRISVGGQGLGRLMATDLDEGSWDNCGIAKMYIRRVLRNETTCALLPDSTTAWSDVAYFSCCDAGTNVPVELLVVDSAGNENSCETFVSIEEKTKPTCVAPPNQTIQCKDLPLGFTPQDTLFLQRNYGVPFISDNCGFIARELPPVANLQDCGTGSIRRRFEVIDRFGNTLATPCEQVITLVKTYDYAIRFPADAIGYCGQVKADTLQLFPGACDKLLYSVFDEVLTDPQDGCTKILRRYRVVNWCEYDGQSAPVVIGRNEDCRGIPGDEAVWVRRTPTATFIDRDNNPTNANPAAGTKTCAPTNPNGYWRATSSNGNWEYTQHIILLDTVKPVLSYSALTPYCAYDNTNCSTVVEVPFQFSDDCSTNLEFSATVRVKGGAWRPLATTDSILLRGSNQGVLKLTLAIGEHEVFLTGKDGCRNAGTVTIPVKVVDCKVNAPICKVGLTYTLEALKGDTDVDGDGDLDLGMKVVQVSDLISGIISDCSGPVTYSVNKQGDKPNRNQQSVIVTCDDPEVLVLEVYAWDNAQNPYSIQPNGTEGGANYNACMNIVTIKDNLGICVPVGPVAKIQGRIATEHGDAVEGATVNLSGQLLGGIVTKVDGGYNFENLQPGYDFTIAPNMNYDYRNGVTTLDYIVIQQHIKSVTPLQSPYKIIAADVDRSNSVSVRDLIFLRKMILGEIDTFPGNNSWRFVRKSFVFPDPLNPWATFFPEVISINNLNGNFTNGDFVGVKVGDANVSVLANTTMGGIIRSSADTTYLSTPKQAINCGTDACYLTPETQYRIPIQLNDIDRLLGFQGTLRFHDAVQIDSVRGVQLTNDQIGKKRIGENLLAFSWSKGDAGGILSDTLLYAYVRVKTAIRLEDVLTIHSRIAASEAYQSEWAPVPLGWRLEDRVLTHTQGITKAFEVLPPAPNPSRGNAAIRYYLPKSGSVTIRIQDMAGKVVSQERVLASGGWQEYRTTAEQLTGKGVYQVVIRWEDRQKVLRMVVF